MKTSLLKLKSDIWATAIILVTSMLTVADLFLVPGRSANMDGIVHTITPNLFYLSIKQGEFPVGWIDGFANYGLPLGIIAHQLTTYLTALLQFIVNDPSTAFNIVAFLGFFLSALFFYIFLRIYFNPIYSLAGTILFHFSAYRILNLFIRGAMPEFFAGVFIPLLLISLWAVIEKKKTWGLFLITASAALICLTHPFMLVISTFITGPYFLFLLFKNGYLKKESLISSRFAKTFVFMIIFAVLGIGIAGYFILPLILEIKYFYYGQTQNHLTPGNFIGLINYLDPKWYYFTNINILPRGFVVNFGIIETLTILVGVLLQIYLYLKKGLTKSSILTFTVFNIIFIIFFTLKFSDPLYQSINFLGNIQFPWRLFSVLIFLPPIISVFILEKINSKVLALGFILLICFLRFPQLYGKNYMIFPADYYSFTPLNLHAVVMNPIWTAESTQYPVKKTKPEIIEGKGDIKIDKVKNNSRLYQITAKTPLRMVDYTFYFPGWSVYNNGQKVNLEFQDPAFRGVITYRLPEGQNKVEIKFEDTKVRFMGKVISLISLVLLAILFLLKRRINIR